MQLLKVFQKTCVEFVISGRRAETATKISGWLVPRGIRDNAETFNEPGGSSERRCVANWLMA
jgi:hypothetical protein